MPSHGATVAPAAPIVVGAPAGSGWYGRPMSRPCSPLLLALLLTAGCDQAEKAAAEAKRAARKAETAINDVKEAGKEAQRTVKKAVKVAEQLRELLPVDVKRDAKLATETLRDDLNVRAPKGYRAAAVVDVEPVGLDAAKVVVVIPRGAALARVLAASATGFALEPGRHTVMAAGHVGVDDPVRLRGLVVQLMGFSVEEGFKLKHIKTGKQSVAFYEQRVRPTVEDDKGGQRQGPPLTARFLFLEGGRIVHFVGATKGFDERAFKRTVDALARAWPDDKRLYALPKP